MPEQISEVKTAQWFEVRKNEDQYECGVEYYAKAYSMEDVIKQVKRDYIPKHYRSQFNSNGNWSDEDRFDTYYIVGRVPKNGDPFTISFSVTRIDEQDMLDVHRKVDFTT